MWSLRVISTEEQRANIYQRMKRTGMTMAGQILWSEGEIDVLRRLTPDYKTIRQLLKTRSPEAIRHKCNQLGLSKTINLWTGADVAKLRRLYPTAPKDTVIAAFPAATWPQIKSAARRYGFRRVRPPYEKTDHPLIDAIIDRCGVIGWSLADLDEECGTGRYFQRRDWRRHAPSLAKLLKAVAVLGGDVSVTWRY